MLPFANDTITLYNKFEYKDEYNKYKTIYLRKELNSCSWRQSTSTSLVDGSSVTRKAITVRIPKSNDYVTPDVWSSAELELLLEREEELLYVGSDIPTIITIEQKFTLQEGDLIIKGVVTDETTDLTLLKDKYSDRAILIQSVTNNADRGQPLPHYKVQA